MARKDLLQLAEESEALAAEEDGSYGDYLYYRAQALRELALYTPEEEDV
jgi:hypothetical protein